MRWLWLVLRAVLVAVVVAVMVAVVGVNVYSGGCAAAERLPR